MPTDKQIAAQLKKDQNERKRGIISHVTEAALHLIFDSQLVGTTLWPKKGVHAHSTEMFNKSDIIDVQVFVNYNIDGTSNEKMKLNLINKSYPRILKQAAQLEVIMDNSIYNGVYFEYVDISHIGLGLDRTWTTMDFKFTIND